jgi:hypothetical protein
MDLRPNAESNPPMHKPALVAALVTHNHHDPRNFQPKPFRQFFDAHGELLELKGVISTIELPRPGTKTLRQRTRPG